MRALRVLITNHFLRGRTGSELYVCELATSLLRRGHTPIVYSPQLGPTAHELREATVPVVDNLDAISSPPDLIHGQHDLVKVLGDGDLTKKLKISAHRFSQSALDKIKKAGGEAVVLPGPAPVVKNQKRAKKKTTKA